MVPGSQSELAAFAAHVAKTSPTLEDFIRELDGPLKKYPSLEVSPAAKLLLAVTGAALAKPGWCLVISPARHADYRVEAIRLGIRVAASASENLLMISKSRSAVQHALAHEKTSTAKAVVLPARNLDEIPDPTNVGGHGLVLVDLDSIDRDVRLKQLRAAIDPQARAVVLVTTRTDLPIVSDLAKAPFVNVFGLNEAQLLAADQLPELEMDLVKDWTWVDSAYRRLPATFYSLDEAKWMKPIWQNSRHWKAAVYRALASAIARRDLMRQTRVTRDVTYVEAPELDVQLTDTRRAVMRLRARAKGAELEFSNQVHDLVADIVDLFYRISALAVPGKKYDQAVAKHPGHVPLGIQLAEVAASVGRLGSHPLANESAVAVRCLETLNGFLYDRNPKMGVIGRFVVDAIASNEQLTIVVNDEVEKTAIVTSMQEHAVLPDGRATRARLERAGIQVRTARELRLLELEGTLVLAMLPQYWLAREAYVSGARRVAAVLFAADRERYVMVQGRDRLIESILFTPARQAATLRAVGHTEAIPPLLSIAPTIDRAATEAQELTKPAADPEQRFDNTEFYSEDDAFARAASRRALLVANDGNATDVQALPRNADLEGIRVEFTDGSYIDCDPEMRLDLVPDDQKSQTVVKAANVRVGAYVLIGSQDASRSTIGTIGARLQAKSGRAIDTVEKNNLWRDAIDAYRIQRHKSWAQVHEDCVGNGYSNKTPWTLVSYVAPWVWLPDDPGNFRAILKTVSPDELYPRHGELFEASTRLRRISGKLKSTLKADFKTRSSQTRKDAADVVLDEEWGVTAADFEDLFDLKQVQAVKRPIVFQNHMRGRLQLPRTRTSSA